MPIIVPATELWNLTPSCAGVLSLEFTWVGAALALKRLAVGMLTLSVMDADPLPACLFVIV
jgi:hypothetical protein